MDSPEELKKWKLIIAVLLVLLFISCTVLGVTLVLRNRDPHPTVMVPMETTSVQAEQTQPTPAATEATVKPKPTTKAPTAPKQEEEGQAATLLQLHKRQDGDNVAFYAVNLFPGDSVTQYYCVRVSHSDDLTLQYHASVREGFEKLAEVLKVRVKVGGTTRYDGLMKDMPPSLTYRLKTDERVTADLVYEVTAYLDTSVNNDYVNQMLVADFEWWIEEAEHLTSPKTGDTSGIYLWGLLGIGSLAALLWLVYILYKKNRQLMRLLLVVIVLVLSLSTLCVSTFAATRLGVDVTKNIFKTGKIKINLNNGMPVATYQNGENYTGNEIFARFEPGMTVYSPFFIENVPGESTGDVLYKLYFTNVEGELADVLDVTITEDKTGNVVLYRGKVSEFTRGNVSAAMGHLAVGERQNLWIWFHFPEETGNDYQKAELSFELCASAVQAKNNPSGEFE